MVGGIIMGWKICIFFHAWFKNRQAKCCSVFVARGKGKWEKVLMLGRLPHQDSINAGWEKGSDDLWE